jgi:hypothetical protein
MEKRQAEKTGLQMRAPGGLCKTSASANSGHR